MQQQNKQRRQRRRRRQDESGATTTTTTTTTFAVMRELLRGHCQSIVDIVAATKDGERRTANGERGKKGER